MYVWLSIYGSAYLPTYLLKKSKCIKKSLNIEDQVKMKHSILLDRITSENVFLSFFFFFFHFHFFIFGKRRKCLKFCKSVD